VIIITAALSSAILPASTNQNLNAL